MAEYTITEGELMDFAAMSSSGDRWELVDKIRDRAGAHVLPIEGTQLGYVHHMDVGVDYREEGGRQFDIVPSAEVANVITSKLIAQNADTAEDQQYHYVVLDVDYPVKAIPSTTPGHSHLYIEKALKWAEYKDLLDMLADFGIIEEGYHGASEREGFTSVRLPWIKKATPEEETSK